MFQCIAGLTILFSLAVACASDASSEVAEPNDAGRAARAAFAAWSAGRSIEYRDLSSTVLDVQNDHAIVELQATVQAPTSQRWQPISIEIPVSANENGHWQFPEPASIDRLFRAAHVATRVALEPTPDVSTRPQATVEPSPTSIAPTPRPELPPPPEGSVIYESDWSSGLDGWIGTPDWTVDNGKLVNDGTRASRDPWIEAPVQVDPWQAVIVEAQIEVLAGEFGSYGLVARAGNAGWFQFGVRWDATEGDSGSPMGILGMTVRQQTMLADREIYAEPRPLEPGPHLYRAEIRDGVATYFIDGHQVGQIEEGEFAPGEFIGLWSERTPLEVHFFRVTLV